MTGAEEERTLPNGHGQGECAVLGRLIGEIAALAGEGQRQIAGLVFGDTLQQGGGEGAPRGIRGGDEGEQHRYVAAAHHADVLGFAAVQLVLPHVAAFARYQLLRMNNGQVLHIAAADGARLGALGVHQHLRACAARRGAGLANDGGQHGVVLLFHFIQQLGKNRLHSHPLLCCILYHTTNGACPP